LAKSQLLLCVLLREVSLYNEIMQSFSIIFIAVVALALSVVVLATLDIIYYISNKRRSVLNFGSKGLVVDEDKAEKSANIQKKAEEIIEDASETARNIYAQAEIQAIKRSEEVKHYESQLHARYENELRLLKESMQTRIVEIGDHGSQTMLEIEKRIAELSSTYETAISQQMELSQEQFKITSAKHLENVQNMLTAMERDTAGKIAEAVERELSTSRAEVAAYRASRQRMVDDHIIDILERTAMITLSEALTLNEHSRLIYRALDHAKKELFFEKTR
jgi:hypothetical protein